MSRMTIRSTYALDEQTARRIRRLAEHWRVSQAEVIRRSVRQAEEQEQEPVPTPSQVIEHYRSGPLPRSRSQARTWASQARTERHAGDIERTTGDEA